jgi:hypothetical protein
MSNTEEDLFGVSQGVAQFLYKAPGRTLFTAKYYIWRGSSKTGGSKKSKTE